MQANRVVVAQILLDRFPVDENNLQTLCTTSKKSIERPMRLVLLDSWIVNE